MAQQLSTVARTQTHREFFKTHWPDPRISNTTNPSATWISSLRVTTVSCQPNDAQTSSVGGPHDPGLHNHLSRGEAPGLTNSKPLAWPVQGPWDMRVTACRPLSLDDSQAPFLGGPLHLYPGPRPKVTSPRAPPDSLPRSS